MSTAARRRKVISPADRESYARLVAAEAALRRSVDLRRMRGNTAADRRHGRFLDTSDLLRWFCDPSAV